MERNAMLGKFTELVDWFNDLTGGMLGNVCGPVKDMAIKIGGPDGLQWREEFTKFLRKEPCWINGQVTQVAEPKPAASILELISTVGTAATTTKFVAREKFVADTSRKAAVKISAVWDNFTTWFLSGTGKIEDPISEQTLRYHKLRKSSVDGPIIAELGGEAKAETTLSEIYDLMAKQAKGEKGVLLNNGWANIFYVRDQNGVLRAVRVPWDGDGWDVNANSIENPDGWSDGRQVFSRNSC